MKIVDLDEVSDISDKSYIGLGNFDGIHIAHQKIIKNLIEKSKQDNYKSSILLFKNSSLDLLNNKGLVLTSLDQKISILEDLGLEIVYLISFENIMSLEPIEFLDYLKSIGICGIFVGFDYSFGRYAKGRVGLLDEYSKANNIYLNICDPVYYNNDIVSSSEIRRLIQENNFERAESMLARPYWIQGKVVSGKKLGSKLGFPTANINLSDNFALGQEAVYSSQVKIDEEIYFAATSLGRNISFAEEEIKIEAHILDFSKDIYGKQIEIRFLQALRPMEKFETIEALIRQVKDDIKEVRLVSKDYYGNK